jgi:hypothetical protein
VDTVTAPRARQWWLARGGDDRAERAESADADRALAELYQHAVRSQVALASSALRAELPAVG